LTLDRGITPLSRPDNERCGPGSRSGPDPACLLQSFLNMHFTFTMSNLSPLPSLLAGATARIRAVDALDADRERLEVMGLCAGRTVEVVQTGDPMIVRVLGTRIGLAVQLARAVLVQPHAEG
jgi:Fe2+ transport system protein FeoA